MNLFQELKRRKVFKTIGVYAAAALIIIQVTDIVFPRLLLPDWTVTFVIVLVIIGFPITFFLSWNYDIKPDSKLDSGEINPEETTDPEVLQTEKPNLNIYTITGGALAVIGIIFWFFFSTSSLSIAEEDLIENSIAVFSFDNLSTREETSRMGEILQHLIISDLSGLTHLKVISHQRLQDIQKQTSEGIANYTIAQQANAKVLLSGSIMNRNSGQKIILGELIDAINGNVIKSHRIEGTDIFSMVDELTDSIRQDLDISKHADDQLALEAGTKTTQSLDAYEKYLEGIKYFNQLEWDTAVKSFNEAIAIDSTFMDAYFYLTISLGWADDYKDTDQSAEEICKIILDKKLYHNEIEKQRVEGTYLYTQGEYNASLPFFEKLIEIEPDNKLNWYGIGEAYYHTATNSCNHADAGTCSCKRAEATKEENYPKALSSMHKVLELDPDFHTALYHIFDVLAYNNDWEEMINFDSKYKVNISGKIQHRVLRAYEKLGYLEKAEKYYEKIEQTLISTDSTGEGLCYINADIAYTLAKEDTLFQRAKYYAEQGIKICPPEFHRWLWQSGIVFIASTYPLEGVEAGKKAYYQLIKNMDIKDQFNFTYRVGNAIYHSVKLPQFKLTYDDALFYLNLAIDLSKQLESQKYFTKAVYYYHRALYKARGSEFSLQKMEEQINEHCGGTININCYSLHEKSFQTFQVLYGGGAYELANEIGQFILDTYNMVLAENLFDEDDTQYFTQRLSQLHYSLGMIKLKKGDYNNARQNFYTALSKYVENYGPDLYKIKSRIAECYFKNKDYSQAIKKFRNNYYDKSWDSNWKYAELSMLALSEYMTGKMDSAKIHFNDVEEYYDKIDFDDISYYYTDWPLHLYHKSEENINKAQQYLIEAYNHIPEEERKQYLEDNDRLKHLHQYYYIHEIIDAYNQNIR